MWSKLVLLGLVGAAGLTACGGDDDDDSPNLAPQQSAPQSAASSAGDAIAPVAVECQDVDRPPARSDGGQAAPADTLDPEQTWTLTFDTSCGAFTVTLDVESAPDTAASLVALAEAGFFDDTVFHRIVPGFVIQGGDPTQTGGGGPGYQTVDVPAGSAAYTRGVVAMAKTGQEPAGTAGSQFFVVTGTDARLPAEYAVVGEVTAGIDVVELIGTLGDQATERPTQPVVIQSVAVATM